MTAIQSVSQKIRFDSWGDPQEKLFALRNAIQDELADTGITTTRVNLSDTLRSGLASLGKISGFAEYMPESSYIALLVKHTDVSRYVIAATRLRDRFIGIMNRVEDWFGLRGERVQANTPAPSEVDRELPQSLSEMVEPGVSVRGNGMVSSVSEMVEPDVSDQFLVEPDCSRPISNG